MKATKPEHLALIDIMYAFKAEHGHDITIRELMERSGFHSTNTVWVALERMRKRGIAVPPTYRGQSNLVGKQPIPMIIHCPDCRARHIDVGEFATKPHHTHACQSCGFTWRPAIVPTVGVQFLPGFKNPAGEARAGSDLQGEGKL